MSRLPLYGTQGKFTYRLLAMALFGQAIILSFFALVARGILEHATVRSPLLPLAEGAHEEIAAALASAKIGSALVAA